MASLEYFRVVLTIGKHLERVLRMDFVAGPASCHVPAANIRNSANYIHTMHGHIMRQDSARTVACHHVPLWGHPSLFGCPCPIAPEKQN